MLNNNLLTRGRSQQSDIGTSENQEYVESIGKFVVSGQATGEVRSVGNLRLPAVRQQFAAYPTTIQQSETIVRRSTFADPFVTHPNSRK